MMRNRGLRRSLTDFRRHPWLHVISISTITVALLILGGFFLVYRNFEQIAEKTSPRVTGTVYLKEGLAPEQVKSLSEKIEAMEGVETAAYKTKQSVVDELKSFLSGLGMESLHGTDLFPDVLELQILPGTTEAATTELKMVLESFTEVAEADFSEDWMAQYQKIRQLITLFGFVLLAAILIGCSFIIANFMSLRHQSRKSEIDIVRLIGANSRFVIAPFLWEGVIEGLMGASLALVLLYVLKLSLGGIVSVHWSSLLGVREWLFLSPAQFMGVIFGGVAMAFCGSITVFLRFRENRA